ncbi:pro-MCH precursor [Triplophysa rosa]|uniref:Pro-MCH n=2 Tax=Triplophysa rosa TaxID=992332 RepID=A0A9W7T774_TRIRA|nr:pro-MCH precursor [Triplophysa rosa]
MASYTVIFAFALFLEFTAYSSLALPKGITDQESTVQDRLISMPDDGREEGTGLLSFRRYPIIEGRLEDGTKRIFILADTGIKGSPGRETNLAFPKSFPALRGLDHSVDGFSMRDDRRSADDVIPVGRRDVDILRCMIGRVYRPCWQG